VTTARAITLGRKGLVEGKHRIGWREGRHIGLPNSQFIHSIVLSGMIGINQTQEKCLPMSGKVLVRSHLSDGSKIWR
jgi:hypothetical protein